MRQLSLSRLTAARVLSATILILLFTNLMVAIVSRISILDSLSKSVKDFDFTDLYFSRLRLAEGWQQHDDRIVLVNIGHLDRAGIGALISIIDSCDPSVIGLDVVFQGKADSTKDASLTNAIAGTHKIVLASQLFSEDDLPPYDRIATSDSAFIQRHPTGYANLNIPESDRSYGTVRAFPTTCEIAGQTYYPFAYEVTRCYDSTVLDNYPLRSTLQFIDFSGGAAKSWNSPNYMIQETTFTGVDYADVFTANFDTALFRNKIVLLGFMGDVNNGAHTEQFYTPMNERYAGRSLPDMFGVEVHANIAAMMLDNRYIWNSTTLDNTLSFIVLLLCVWACDRIYIRYPRQFQLASTTMAFVAVNLLIFLPLLIFMFFKVKVDLRESVFYLIFVPTFFEIIDVHLFSRFKLFRNKPDVSPEPVELGSLER